MFTVTASHINADYNSLMQAASFSPDYSSDWRVRGDEANGYYASGPLLGCGKTCRTPEAAIHSLLADNGYTASRIVASTPEPTPPAGKPLAKSLHTVTVLVRVARLVSKLNSDIANDAAVIGALQVLGLADMPDTYGLTAAAIKQLDKGA